jgi:putative nucleotidyltransferase with HDIG domain
MSPRSEAEELARRWAAAARVAALYAPDHPLVSRSVDALARACTHRLRQAETLVLGCIGDELVVDGQRVTHAAALAGFVRELRAREVDKIVVARGVTRDELQAVVAELAARPSEHPLPVRLERRGVRHVTLGRLVIEEPEEASVGIAAARKVYRSAVETAEALWRAAQAGEAPDPAAARRIIDSLARLVQQDRTSLLALTALKKYDTYTFTHMVNVSVLAMAQARALGLEGPLLREFGYAALMHDIGKVYTPLEILNKPDRLTKEEFEIMKRHVIDGAHILRRTPEVPALAPIVAFEHHLKQDLSGYPENIGHRELNLCTMIVSIADVFDALRSTRPYREGLPTDRVKAIMARQDSPDFQPTLLRRFVNLMGLYPVGTLVRLDNDALGVVTREHPSDPFRPQVKVLVDAGGERLDPPVLVNTWERDARGEFVRAVVAAVDPDEVGLDPIAYL